MKIRFHLVNITPDIKLLNFVQTKLNKLDLFYNRILYVDAYFLVEPVSYKGNKLVEIKLRVPGKELIVKKHSQSFEGAINQAKEALKKAIIKYKDKLKMIDQKKNVIIVCTIVLFFKFAVSFTEAAFLCSKKREIADVAQLARAADL